MKSLVLIITLIATISAKAQNRVCVLSLFKKNTNYNQIITSSFKDNFTGQWLDPNIDLFQEAYIEQINYCFSSGVYNEIVFASHGMSTATNITNYSFPVIYNAKNDQNELLYARYFKVLSQMIKENSSLKKLRISVCGINFENPIHGKENREIIFE